MGMDPGRAWRRAARRERIAIAAAITIGSLVLIGIVGTLIEHHEYHGRVLPGVEVDGVKSSGRRAVSVYDDVNRLAKGLEQSPLRAKAGGHVLTADPSLLDVDVDARATTTAAMAAGRGNALAQVLGSALRRVRPDHVHLRVEYDESRLEGILDGWSAEELRGEVEGGLHFVGAKVVSIEPRTGTGIFRDAARRALQHMLAGPSRPVVTLPVGPIHPEVTPGAVAIAARRAEQLLALHVTLIVGPRPVPVTALQLASAMGTRVVGHHLDVTLDGARLHAALGTELAGLESPPVDATFAVTEQNTVRVVPSRVGHELDMSAVAAAILWDPLESTCRHASLSIL